MLATAGFTAGFRGTMTPQETTVPVAISNGEGYLPFYGWLLAGPLEQIDHVLGCDVLVMDADDGGTWHPGPEQVTETSGCECGNRWTLCHREA